MKPLRPTAGGYFSCRIGYGGYDHAVLDSGTGTGGYEIDVLG